MKIVILGSTGMLGAYVASYFKKIYSDEDVTIVAPTRESFDILEQIKSDIFGDALNVCEGDIVVNCAGMINKRDDVIALGGEALYLRESISVNSVFPQMMAMWCKSKRIKFVHITTDCVFDGLKGNYSDNDIHNATDIYGITKSCGEPQECILIRSSIIGESGNGRSLIEWLRSQDDKTIIGYTNHKWNGVTCLELARCIYLILINGAESGRFVVTSPDSITKYELCKKISDAYGWHINISPGRDKKDIDRTLIGNIVCDKTIDEQIQEMVKYKQH